MIGVSEGDAAESVLAGNLNRSFHAAPCVQVAGSTVSIPSFECAEADDELRLGLGDDHSALDHAHELGKAVQAVRVNPVPAAFRKKLRAKVGAVMVETQG